MNDFKATTDCPTPLYWGAGEERCGLCGIVWDSREDKPECPLKTNGFNPAEAARQVEQAAQVHLAKVSPSHPMGDKGTTSADREAYIRFHDVPPEFHYRIRQGYFDGMWEIEALRQYRLQIIAAISEATEEAKTND